jgi:hypothetical protein
MGTKSGKVEVYDRVRWHYPEGDAPSLKAALRHFKVMARLLRKSGLLNEDGEAVVREDGLDGDFSLTSDLLTDEGNKVLKKHYDKWLKTVDWDSANPDFWKDKLPAADAGKAPGRKGKEPAKPGKAAGKSGGKAGAAVPEVEVYDSVWAHWPVAKQDGVKTVEQAKNHLDVVMRWLDKHGLLSEKGAQAIASGSVPKTFQLDSGMVGEKGRRLLSAAYFDWLGSVRYGKEPKTDKLDKALAKLG